MGMNKTREAASPAAMFLVLAACGQDKGPEPSSSGSAASFVTSSKANCYPAAKSREYGGVNTARAPFADCAASLKVHCDDGSGTRGGLRGLSLLDDATEQARKSEPDACCYRTCD